MPPAVSRGVYPDGEWWSSGTPSKRILCRAELNAQLQTGWAGLRNMRNRLKYMRDKIMTEMLNLIHWRRTYSAYRKRLLMHRPGPLPLL